MSWSSFSSPDTTNGVWDPISALAIRNPDRDGNLTCVGYAPTQGRRCRRAINQGNRSTAWVMLDKLAMLDPHTDNIEPRLRELAQRTLCLANHQNQVDTMTRQWLAQARQSCCSRPAPKQPKREPRVKVEEPRVKVEEPSIEEVLANIAKLTATLEKLEESVRARAHDAERDRRADEAESRRAREAEQRRKDEQAERQREEEERRERERERERELEAERLRKEAEQERQRAQEKKEQERRRAKEARERKERESREKLRAEFDAAWAAYNEAWEQFDALRKSGNLSTEDLYWPVNSGSFLHVTAKPVEAFYRKALDGKTGAAKRKMLHREALRWHPDRLVVLKLEGGVEEMVLMVMQLVNKLSSEADAERARL